MAEACDVSTNQIHQWLREARLELSAESGVTLSCENCRAAILSGRVCAMCKNRMVNELGDSIKRPEPPKVQKKKDTKENPKMRFLN